MRGDCCTDIGTRPFTVPCPGSGRPSIANTLPDSPPANGSALPAAADRTSGTPRTRAMRSSANCRRSSGRSYRNRGGATVAVTSCSARKPGSTAMSCQRLVMRRTAVTTRTNARASSAVASSRASRRSETWSRMDPAIRSREASPDCADERSAGRIPNSSPASAEIPRANARTRPSIAMSSTRGTSAGSNATISSSSATAPIVPSPR